MRKIAIIFFTAVLVILVLGGIYYLYTKKEVISEDYLKKHPYVISESDYSIQYLTQIYRVDRKNSEYLPYVGKDDFFSLLSRS